MVEVALESRRIRTLAVALADGVVEDVLDPRSHASGRLMLLRPDALEHLMHERGRHVTNEQVAEQGIGVGLKRRAPLGAVLHVAPAGLFPLDKCVRDLPEGLQRGPGGDGGALLGSTGIDRVNAFAYQLVGLTSGTRASARGTSG